MRIWHLLLLPGTSRSLTMQRFFSRKLNNNVIGGNLPYRPATGNFARRWMGSRPLPDNPKGEIYLENEQSDLSIDLGRLKSTASQICSLVGYHSYDLSIFLVDDTEMQQINRDSRGIDKPTDILSFPFGGALESGVLEPPQFDIAEYYNLGDIIVDIPYVMRACQEDASYLSDGSDLRVDDDDNRGVSGAMANVMDPEKRINMLLVHGILHLVGYDHIEDDDYVLMVEREEEVLNLLGVS